MKTYKVIIIEDDIKSSELLELYIKKYCTNLKITGTAKRVEEAIELVESDNPDILILDIQLHENLGFDLLELVNWKNYQIIFISAHKDYALDSFKYEPIDFLLKPFSIIEFKEAINRAIIRIEERAVQKNYRNPFIAVSCGAKIQLLKFENIIYCESNGHYTFFHLLNGEKLMCSNRIGVYEKLLPPHFFLRIHKKYIVNISYVKYIYKSNRYYCELIDGKTLTLARRKQEEIKQLLISYK